MIKELESYRYAKDRFGKNKTESPVKKDDHLIDSLRYSITNFDPYKVPASVAGGSWERQGVLL